MTRGRVIVVGGGPAGSSTAWHLAREGVAVTVLDRARFPRPKACAEYLSPEASRLLAKMGALEPVERQGATHLAGMLVRAPSGEVIHGEFAAAHGFRGFRDRGLAIPRVELDALLLDRARHAGAEVRERVRVTDVLRDGGGRVCGVATLDADGRRGEQRADLVIGADGLRSVVARRLRLARTRRMPNRLAVVGHYEGVRGLGDMGEMHVERDGFCGMAHVGRGLTNLSVVVPARRAGEIAGDAPGFLDRWVAAHPQLAHRFADARRTEPVLATGPFAQHARRAWAPGAALVGDAADYFDPFTGEGIYSALLGGELLAPHACAALDELARRRPAAADRALARYHRARRREFAGRWIVERMIAATIAWPPLINRAARVLARRRDMADLLVGVTGDFVPASAVLRPGFLYTLFLGRVA